MGAIVQQTLSTAGVGGVVAPAATAAPAYGFAPLLERQADEGDQSTCGYISLPNSFMRMLCPGSCTTTASYFGCDQWFLTKCYNEDDPVCTGALKDGEMCCTIQGAPNCVTASKRIEGKWLTNFACGGDHVSGKVLALDQTSSLSTSSQAVSTTDKQSDITSTLPSSTLSSSTLSSSTSSSSTSTSSQDPAGGQSSTSSNNTNVGAIVGGVVGGIALLALIAFGVWFVRFQKRKEAKNVEKAHPYDELAEPEHPDAKQPGVAVAYAPGSTPTSTHTVPAHPPPAFQEEYPMQNIDIKHTPIVEAPASPLPVEMPADTAVQHKSLAEAPSDNYKRVELS